MKSTVVEDMPFKTDILHRIQKLEEKSILQNQNADIISDKVSEKSLRGTGFGDASATAVMAALKRIETLEDQQLNKYQQKMLDEKGVQDTKIIMRMEELEKKLNAKDVDGAMSRLETVENLVINFKQ